MKVRVLFFAGLREALACKERLVELPAGSSLGDLVQQLEKEHPPVAHYASRLVISLNAERRALDSELSEGDEVALLPPMSGGSGLR